MKRDGMIQQELEEDTKFWDVQFTPGSTSLFVCIFTDIYVHRTKKDGKEMVMGKVDTLYRKDVRVVIFNDIYVRHKRLIKLNGAPLVVQATIQENGQLIINKIKKVEND